MEFNILTLLGLLAATLTTGALVPQTVKTWKTKSAGDLSLYMYLMMTAGIIIWLVYGWLRQDIPLILANGIGFCFAATILYFKIKEILAGKK
ncbi:MAG: hypothetical protein EPO28_07190 [Saprospiraceae bacterium]|nr:MAG: hypothetical protein EPO28_07190 [Saprospiraceae bacterium]